MRYLKKKTTAYLILIKNKTISITCKNYEIRDLSTALLSVFNNKKECMSFKLFDAMSYRAFPSTQLIVN